MPGCVFRVSGSTLDLDKALKFVSFTPYMTYQKGDPIKYRKNEEFHDDTGFKAMASEASGYELSRQLEEADSFLKRHEKELAQIEGIDDASLDFGYYCRIGTGSEGKEIVVQYDRIEPALLKRCGDLGIRIELSLYPAPNDENTTNSEHVVERDAGHAPD